MTRSGTSAGFRHATLVAAYATPADARSVEEHLRRRHLTAVSLLWLEGTPASGAPGADEQSLSEDLVIEGSLLTPLHGEVAPRGGVLGAVAGQLRRLGLIESSLDHYSAHLTQGHAILVAYGIEAEIEGVYRSVRRASLAVHHVTLD